MVQATAVVVGAGHAGLAMSRRLTERSIDHVVLERGQVANSWRTQRWPSLRLLTPKPIGPRRTEPMSASSSGWGRICCVISVRPGTGYLPISGHV